mmetsp:Transcript_9286/g.34346  ORF Transcript_9286/g.34346 Transcript_9286/m.34346 type:complete len:111 (-) Transcript_9286:429-761(-)
MSSNPSRIERITSILKQSLSPSHLKIHNDSHLHAHHAAMRQNPNAGNETHLRLELVSSKFEGMNRVARHRMVYELLQEQLDSGLHALQINARTQGEWDKLIHKKAHQEQQ